MLIHRFIGEKYNVPVYGLTQASHINIDRRRYIIVPKTFRQTTFLQEFLWKKFRDLHLDNSMIFQIGNDLLYKFCGSGSHAYSPAKQAKQINLVQSLELSPNRHLLVAYTSSRDEVVSVSAAMDGLGIKLPQKRQPFEDQIAWLKALVHFVETSTHLQLVVRIHPRESRNKRDSQISQHLSLLLENFDRSFKHCRFIWPESTISSYDLAEIADLVLTSWSSIGLECARLGIPVLTATNGIAPFPQDDFLEWGQTPEQYFKQLTKSLNSTLSLDRVMRAFRWYYLYHLGSSVDLGDLIPAPDFTGLPEFRMPREAKTIEDIIIHGKDILEINYNRLAAAQSPDSSLTEAQAITQQLCRIFHFIFTGQDDLPINDMEIKFQYIPEVSSIEKLVNQSRKQAMSSKDQIIAFVGHQDKEVFYISPNGQALQRYSPLCARLIPLIAY